jgi:hypothetical protein
VRMQVTLAENYCRRDLLFCLEHQCTPTRG